jgi:hypothetical protein
VGIGHLDTELMGSNTVLGLDVCPRLSTLCCSVEAEASCLVDQPSRESYHM